MSLATLDTKIAALRTEASALIREYRGTISLVKGDPNLTREGKAAQIDGLLPEVRRKVAALAAQEKAAIAAEALALERRIGGTASQAAESIMSFRDAQDRAAAITSPVEALAAIKRAIAKDDRELAQAYVTRAMTESDRDPLAQAFEGIEAATGRWTAVVEAYIEAYPVTAGAVRDLFDLRRRERSLQHNFASAGAYAVL